MLTERIPATIVTGFLGAGKTTMIRHMLENAGGRRIALIINEFGDLGVDGEVLRSCGVECADEDVIELTNGCICCTVADDFIPTIEALLERQPIPDHIVIETSGLALPQPLVSAFNWPGIRERVTVDGVVAVVDGPAVAEGRFAHDLDAVQAQREADEELDHESPLEELYEDQLRAADVVILNKADLLPEGEVEKLRGEVGREMVAAPRVVPATNGALPIDVLLGIGAATENQIGERKSHHELHHDGEEHDHDHDEFHSFVVESGPVRDVEQFVDHVRSVIQQHDILRLKGFLDVPGKPMRMVIQAVGNRIDYRFDRLWGGDERKSRLVVIGLHEIDEEVVRDGLGQAFEHDPEPA